MVNTELLDLKGKTQKEKVKIKSKELAKVKLNKFTKDNLEIEIIGDIGEIKGGIQLFARAFKNGQQLGFSKDGTIDIERFRFFNPPVLVEDENGNIIREYEDEDTKEVKQRKLKYDPEKVIKSILTDTISLVAKDGSNIIDGKIGSTTSTFYPSAGDVSPSDASLYATYNGGETFSDLRDIAGTGVSQNSPTVLARLSADGNTDKYDNITRGMFGFDTSSLSGQSVSSATFSIYGASGKQTTLSQSITIDRGVPVDSGEIAITDFIITKWDGVEQSSTRITDDDWNESGYNVFTINETGIGNIDTEGLTWFGTRVSADLDDDEPTWGTGTNDSRFVGHRADTAGTANDPKLVVEHEIAPIDTGNFLNLF